MKILINIAKHFVLAVFAVIAAAILLVILSEESTDTTLLSWQFFALKMAAFAAIYPLYLAARYCYNRGLFPEYIYRKWEGTADEA